jgi:hypothetical protein
VLEFPTIVSESQVGIKPWGQFFIRDDKSLGGDTHKDDHPSPIPVITSFVLVMA